LGDDLTEYNLRNEGGRDKRSCSEGVRPRVHIDAVMNEKKGEDADVRKGKLIRRGERGFASEKRDGY